MTIDQQTESTDDDADLSPADKTALTLALSEARSLSRRLAQDIDRMITEHGWRQAAEFASYTCQAHHLRLRPWHSVPCWTEADIPVEDGDPTNRREAQQLLKQMLDLHLSRWEPNPLASIRLAKTPTKDLRQCPQCQRAFPARRRWQRFCRDECRSAFHQERIQQARMFNVTSLDAARQAERGAT